MPTDFATLLAHLRAVIPVDEINDDGSRLAWIREATDDADTVRELDDALRPECSRCGDSGIALEQYGPDEWPVVCSCAAARGLSDEEIVFTERGARRQQAAAYNARP